MENFILNRLGTVNCDINHPEHGLITTTLSVMESQKIIDSGVEIAPYVEPVKTAEQLKAEVVQELKSLDASPRTITEALLGDQWAIDELKRLEAEKVILRDKLKSL